jgi:hypothetical protein
MGKQEGPRSGRQSTVGEWGAESEAVARRECAFEEVSGGPELGQREAEGSDPKNGDNRHGEEIVKQPCHWLWRELSMQAPRTMPPPNLR